MLSNTTGDSDGNQKLTLTEVEKLTLNNATGTADDGNNVLNVKFAEAGDVSTVEINKASADIINIKGVENSELALTLKGAVSSEVSIGGVNDMAVSLVKDGSTAPSFDGLLNFKDADNVSVNVASGSFTGGIEAAKATALNIENSGTFRLSGRHIPCRS